ncbi:type II CAAX endopeptidase family protein [Mesobacillus subterraneus]|uniref:CPBP family intramembrane glutamic endopeptidase n=1 Tax=Mesobacillus subterraneus TaxID=285983 RepID=UPI00273FEEC5|nr:type II CAAX endopeptidase family protein [Mesobacillus subterraneus]WLR57250.1 type II CAAX endopeptidase family protein [Mesobacillus subterraneus]
MELKAQETAARIDFTKRENIELYIIIVLMVVSVIFVPVLKGIIAIAPILYFFIERKVRKRTLEEIGFSSAHIKENISNTWKLILFTGIAMQLLYLFSYKNFFPEVLEHVLGRIPLDFSNLNPLLFLSIALLAFGEEIVFRGLIQARLSKLMPVWVVILVTSLLFAAMHISTGEGTVVIVDLLSVFIDSILFGIIFAKTRNIYIVTLAHILANTVALLSIYLFVV